MNQVKQRRWSLLLVGVESSLQKVHFKGAAGKSYIVTIALTCTVFELGSWDRESDRQMDHSFA